MSGLSVSLQTSSQLLRLHNAKPMQSDMRVLNIPARCNLQLPKHLSTSPLYSLYYSYTNNEREMFGVGTHSPNLLIISIAI